MLSNIPLLAIDAGAVKLIVIVIIGAFYAISHLIKLLKGVQTQATRRTATVDQAEVRKKLESELGDFLRRARSGPAQPVEPPRPKEKKKQPRKKLVEERRPLSEQQQPVVAQVLDAPASRLAAHLDDQQHLDTSRFDRWAQNMTHIARESEQMESHIQQTFDHQAFDHQLGSLGGRASNQSEGATISNNAPVAVAPQLAAMLADPQSMRQAIILQEILNRPEHRW